MKKKVAPPAAHIVQAAVEVALPAPPATVWTALLNETTHWWPRTFWTSERTQRFVIEPRLGGRVYEDFGDNEGFIWYTVQGIDSPRSLQLTGFMGPPFGGPLCTLLRLELTPEGPKGTKLVVTDAGFGQVAGCDSTEGWRTIFAGHFLPYVANKVTAPAPKRRAKKS